MTRIAVIIPARGGSKRLKNKNIAPLWGKPMIYWALQAALGVTDKSDIFVSTESKKVKDVIQNLDFNVIDRLPELAEDHVPKMDAVRHAYFSLEKDYDVVVSLQANSPEIHSSHLNEALEVLDRFGRDELFSVDSDLMQNAAFRIIRGPHMRFNDFSINCGVFVCDIADVHTQEDIDDLKFMAPCNKCGKRYKVLFDPEKFHNDGLCRDCLKGKNG